MGCIFSVNSTSTIEEAIDVDDFAKIREMVQKGATLELRDDTGAAPLIYAAQNANDGAVSLLLELGAYIDSRNTDGETALMVAACAGTGFEKIVQILLERKANIETKDQDGQTPLIGACSRGNEQIVEMLLKNGAKIEATDRDGWTPILWAASNGHPNVVGMLIENGANTNIRTLDDRTIYDLGGPKVNDAIKAALRKVLKRQSQLMDQQAQSERRRSIRRVQDSRDKKNRDDYDHDEKRDRQDEKRDDRKDNNNSEPNFEQVNPVFRSTSTATAPANAMATTSTTSGSINDKLPAPDSSVQV